jgi:hypothetical protein
MDERIPIIPFRESLLLIPWLGGREDEKGRNNDYLKFQKGGVWVEDKRRKLRPLKSQAYESTGR